MMVIHIDDFVPECSIFCRHKCGYVVHTDLLSNFGNSNKLILAIMFYHLRAQEWEFGIFRSLVEMMVSLIDECVCQNVGSLAGKREDLVYIPISYCQ